MIGSFGFDDWISCCNSFTSLILTTWEIPVKYIPIACLPRTFPVFPPFLFSFRCLHLAYVLLIVSLLASSILSCVHCFLPSSKYTLPLLVAPFNYSSFLCGSTTSFVLSTVYAKNSSLFNIFSAFAIIFITDQNCHHIAYRGNINASNNFL